MADLVTKEEVKVALRIAAGNTERDAEFDQAIDVASAAIRSYLDRDFETPVSASETRTYYYDGSGVLEIDDAQTITAVTLDGAPLTTDEYSAEPSGNAPYTWLFLPSHGRSVNPEMGFERNLDTLWWKTLDKPQVVQITGTWGWPSIPWDVKQAAIWTVVNITETQRPVTAESIGGVARQYSGSSFAIPIRARELLSPYFRGRF
jgi:hypothetical protein